MVTIKPHLVKSVDEAKKIYCSGCVYRDNSWPSTEIMKGCIDERDKFARAYRQAENNGGILEPETCPSMLHQAISNGKKRKRYQIF